MAQVKVIQTRDKVDAKIQQRLERFRRMGIGEVETRIYAGLGSRNYRNASKPIQNFQPLTPEELAEYED